MWQLIYTSSPRGLASGQSGFCTVARSADLREALAHRLEQISSYHHLEFSSPGRPTRNPTISAYRILDIRGTKFHTLTKIQPAGLDFTARTNHLAQHLVFSPEELAPLPSPAAILRDWKGWLESWQGEPRILEPLSIDSFSHMPAPAWPANAWQKITGDAGRAAGLLEGEYARGCFLLCRSGGEPELLELFCETLQLPNWTGKYPLRTWQYSFTTFLQGQDAYADFQWRGCQEGTPAWDQAMRRAVPLVKLEAIRIPNNPLAKFAREGPKPAIPSVPSLPRSGPVTLRKEPAGNRQIPTPEQRLRVPKLDETRRAASQRRAGPGIQGHSSLFDWLSRPAVKTVGIAVILFSVLVFVKYWWTLAPSDETTPRNPATARAGTNSSPPEVVKSHHHAASSTNMSKAGQPEAASPEMSSGPSAKDIQTLDDFQWQEAAVYLVSLPNLNNTDINLVNVEPLNKVLGWFDRFELTPRDLKVFFNVDRLSFGPPRFPMEFELKQNREVVGVGHSPIHPDIRFSMSYPGASDSGAASNAVRIRASYPETLRAFSILIAPANGAKQNFEPFRLLVVNGGGGNRPRPLDLDVSFLKAHAMIAPEDLQPPLPDRLRQFHFANGERWRLRPYIPASGGKPGRYLYEQWKSDEKPPDSALLEFARVKMNLGTKFETLGDQVAELEKQIADCSASLQNIDLTVPLGSSLGITNNPELNSIQSYTNFIFANPQPATSRSVSGLTADLYLRYLDQLKEKAPSSQDWLRTWSSPRGATEDAAAQSLNQLYALYVAHVPSREPDVTQKQEPIPNYFFAVWRNLKAEQKAKELQQSKRNKEQEMQSVREHQADLDLAYLSLCLDLAPDRWLEVIRFSGSAAALQP
jgi:hypothetical protein